MPIFALDKSLAFPPVHLAEPDGLLAVGGDLSRERLLVAYKEGIFPWYEGKDILWWCPHPRFVLFPDELRVSKSMQTVSRTSGFEFRTDTAFAEVIANCKTVSRRGQESTWISDDVRVAYTDLHNHGYAHSAETWFNGKLVGGLYGIRLGNIFFGESMFSLLSNASKFAFITFVEMLKKDGIVVIDCQVYTPHLESLGARMIDRKEFTSILRANC